MGAGKSFAETDSWAVALSFVIFGLISVLIERFVHWLKHHVAKGSKTLLQVVHKAEEELFLLGTVSFILLVFQELIIEGSCVDSSKTFRPSTWAICGAFVTSSSSYQGASSYYPPSPPPSRHLLGAAGVKADGCPEGQEPFLSEALLHQVHLFIFFLAICHVIYSATALSLGKRRLATMLKKRTRHMEKTMMSIAKLLDSDAHCLVSESAFGRAARSKSKIINNDAAATPAHFQISDDLPIQNPQNAVKSFEGEATISVLGVDEVAVTVGDHSAVKDAPFDEGESRHRPKHTASEKDITLFSTSALKGKMSYSDMVKISSNAPDRLKSFERSVTMRQQLYPYRGLYHRFKEQFGLAVPETTLVCFELLFLRTHNIQSHKFDFAKYVLECIEANSCEMLGLSPGRWLMATAIIFLWGPVNEIHVIVSLTSLALLVVIAFKLRRTIDVIIAIEHEGGLVTDDVFWFGRPQFIEELFIGILYQQAFHLASWLFGAWQIGVGRGYGCYYGSIWSFTISAVLISSCFILGGGGLCGGVPTHLKRVLSF